jgi:hypothetical protein
MLNPFTLGVIPPRAAFCNRKTELKELSSHARNKANVVMFSPRRYGKTSLVKKLQRNLMREKYLTIYSDFFMVTSENDVAQRMAKSIYTVLHHHESLLKKGTRYLKVLKTFRPVFKPSADKGVVLSVEPVSANLSGIEILDKIMEEFGDFVSRQTAFAGVHIVFDEFQEITDLKGSQIEGVLRNHIQEHDASYFFVGSRRRILLDIFNNKSRPFYQSATMYSMKALPSRELTRFLQNQFKKGGKRCSRELAEKVSEITAQYPYYVQALAYHVFEVSGPVIKAKDIESAFDILLASERYGYEGIVQDLTSSQIALLKALANHPTSKIMSTEYMQAHRLSIGGIQYACKKLEGLDLIERLDGLWRVVDPVFATWLTGY